VPAGTILPTSRLPWTRGSCGISGVLEEFEGLSGFKGFLGGFGGSSATGRVWFTQQTVMVQGQAGSQ